jgi:serine phosphatase RsbU (regulator of sigma subunit)/anti-sigma regulatory factor (Ser/Thr protein kinase)
MRARKATLAPSPAPALEDAFDGGVPLRRGRLLAVLLAGLVLVGVAGGLAWHQYDNARRSAVNDARARVILASAMVDTYFSGELAALSSIAQSATVRSGDAAAMRAYFRRVEPPAGGPFPGGLGWIDRDGLVQAASGPSSPARLNLSDRSYFKTVMATGGPFVSEGLASRRTHRHILVMAVPTRDAQGALTGVLTGALLIDGFRLDKASLDLGFTGLAVLDRAGRALVSGFARPRNIALERQLRQEQVGLLSSVRGLDDGPDHLVAFATAQLPGWTIAIDRPRADVFAAARHGLLLALALLAAAAATAFGFIGWLLLRARREADDLRERARQRSELSHALSAASLAAEVARGLASALTTSFPGSLAIVALEADDRLGLQLSATGDAAAPAGASELVVTRACHRAYESGVTFALANEQQVRDELPDLHRALGRAHRSLYCAPLRVAGARPIGALCLLFEGETELGQAEEAHVAWYAGEAAQALARARSFEHEHDVAVSLQRSLLSQELPMIDGVELLGHYEAGSAGLEVGGDWYDVVRRDDGIVQISVGDVAGRGLPAAVLMGQMRNAFRAYVYDHSSPAEVLRRMRRHVAGDAMATAVCMAFDPYTRRLTYASAGHPPSLLLAGDTVSRLDAAGAPPLGFAATEVMREVEIALPPEATVVAYTDGLVERRDWSLDVGIDLLADVLAASSSLGPEVLAARILTDVASRVASGDDIAFLVVRACGVPERMDIEIPGDPALLAGLRRRLRRWLELRGLSEQEREDAVLSISEACNNAIEHAYGGSPGAIRLMLHHHAGALEITVEDHGSWRAPSFSPERGHGIEIMRAVMHDASIQHESGRTRVLLSRRLGS